MKLLDMKLDLKSLTKTEIKIAEYVSKNLPDIMYMSTEEIAQTLNVSTATISRFWKSMGYDNFKSFKAHCKNSIFIGSPADKMKDIIKRVNDKDILQEMINFVFTNLEKTSKSIERELLEKVVNKITLAKKIYIFASGAAQSLSSLLSFRLNRLGYDVEVMPSSGHSLFEALLNIKKEDIVLVFCFSHVLPEHQVIAAQGKEIGFTTILINDLNISDIIDKYDIVLQVERGEMWEFHSMVTPLLLVETIVVHTALKDESKSMERLNYLYNLRKNYKKYLPR